MFVSGSIKLFQVAGTTVRVHLTFFLLLAWLGIAFWVKDGPMAAVYGVGFILILFACVTLHEFGHIFAARRYGIKTPDVTLLPIGGVASLERMPEKPQREIFVAIAGPLVNLVIAGVIVIALGGKLNMPTDAQELLVPQNFISQIAIANIALFVFNLVPAFPMDGGRIFRAILTFFYGYLTATQIAMRVGQALAILFGVLGLMGNPVLILIALFIFLAATGEGGQVAMRAVLDGMQAKDAMIDSFETLETTSTLEVAAGKLLHTTQQEFPILDHDGHVVGILTRRLLVENYHARGADTRVSEVMDREVPTVSENVPASRALDLLQKSASGVVAVVHKSGRLLGFINAENLTELLMLRKSVTAPATQNTQRSSA